MRIAVLAGGSSPEREVSLESGANVAQALRERGHMVELLDPGTQSVRALAFSSDVIVPMLHGTGAEDGQLQRDLAAVGIPWIGSSAEASAITFDKAQARRVFAAHRLPIAPGVVIEPDASSRAILQTTAIPGFPLVVKPVSQGSSVGISVVHSPDELLAAVASARQWSDQCLLERYIPGRELTVPVIEGVVFPAVEILPARSWYDYSAKYADNETRYRVNPEGLPENLNSIVLAACRACGVSAISRTDLRMDPSGNVVLLEINTIPGMTSHSLVPMSAASLGISIGELIEDLVVRRLDPRRVMPQPHWMRRVNRSEFFPEKS